METLLLFRPTFWWKLELSICWSWQGHRTGEGHSHFHDQPNNRSETRNTWWAVCIANAWGPTEKNQPVGGLAGQMLKPWPIQANVGEPGPGTPFCTGKGSIVNSSWIGHLPILKHILLRWWKNLVNWFATFCCWVWTIAHIFNFVLYSYYAPEFSLCKFSNLEKGSN